MTFISYAQNHEDVMLSRALRGVEKGFYIDAGAQDPIVDSVTRAFYERGWRGINIEPIDEYYNKLKADRPEDINLKLALSFYNGELTIHEFPHTGLSTTKDEYAINHQKEGYEEKLSIVPCTTLNDICLKYGVNEVQFLKIDVEGSEREVIEGFSFESIRPWILLVEAIAPVIIGGGANSFTTNNTSADWMHLVLEKGYELVYFDGLNYFFVAKEHAELKEGFNLPPNIFDGYITYTLWQHQQELTRSNYLLEEMKNANSHLSESISLGDEKNARLSALLKQKDSDIAKLAESVKLSKSGKEEMKRLLKQVNTENQQITKALEWSEKERETQKGKIEELVRRTSILESIADKLHHECDDISTRLSSEIHSLHQIVADRDARIAELNSHLVANQNHIEALISSTSWRITAPLRHIKLLYVALLNTVIRAGRWSFSFFSHFVNLVIERSVKSALSVFWIRRLGRSVISRFPRLKAYLLRKIGVGIIYGIADQFNGSATSRTVESELPETASLIYGELCKHCLTEGKDK